MFCNRKEGVELLEEAKVAVLTCLVLSIPVLLIAVIVWFNRHKRAKKFEDNPNEEGYICPICHMSNDSKNICERCGFDPKTKEGNVAYDEDKVKEIMKIINRGI